jgi:uncharacterized protein with HEPN domain
MSERSDREFLEHMLEAARRILTYTTGIDYASFQQDYKTQDAVMRKALVNFIGLNWLSTSNWKR